MDPRTRAYFRELANATEANRKLADAVQEICTCVNCIGARTNKTLAAYDNAKLMREMHDKIIGTTPSNYAPELDPNYFLFQSGKRRAF
jgi:hypothetical protein